MSEILENTLGFYHTEDYIILNGEKKESSSIFGIHTQRGVYEEVYFYGTDEEYLKCINAMSDEQANHWVAYCLSANEINERDYLLFQRFHHLINEDELSLELDSKIQSKLINDVQEYHMAFYKKYKLKTVFYDAEDNTPTDIEAHNYNKIIEKKYWDFDSDKLAIEYKENILERWKNFTDSVLPIDFESKLYLSINDAEFLIKSLGNPPKINNKLLKAAQKYKNIISDNEDENDN